MQGVLPVPQPDVPTRRGPVFEDRLVIHACLRSKVLTVLHAAHQGKSTMLHRAAYTVFWPGYTIDVEKKLELKAS